MAKKSPVETAGSAYIQANVSQEELDACIQVHLDAVTTYIRTPRPNDGTLPQIVAALRLLQSEIVARDDKLGRGLSQPDAE